MLIEKKLSDKIALWEHCQSLYTFFTHCEIRNIMDNFIMKQGMSKFKQKFLISNSDINLH